MAEASVGFVAVGWGGKQCGATLEAGKREDGSIARRKIKVEGKVAAFY
jgi:hypothetical protein